MNGARCRTYSRYVPYLVVLTDIFALYVALVMYKDGPAYQESTARPLRGHLCSRYETQKSISDHEKLVGMRVRTNGDLEVYTHFTEKI